MPSCTSCGSRVDSLPDHHKTCMPYAINQADRAQETLSAQVSTLGLHITELRTASQPPLNAAEIQAATKEMQDCVARCERILKQLLPEPITPS
jgi:hypothetical protein